VSTEESNPSTKARSGAAIVHYDFEAFSEGEDTVQDRSGNGNHADVESVGTVETSHGMALVFDGQSSMVTPPPVELPPEYTIECTFRTEGFDGWQVLVKWGGSVLAHRDGEFFGQFWDAEASEQRGRAGVSADGIDDGEWTHVLYSYNGETHRLFLDGKLAAETAAELETRSRDLTSVGYHGGDTGFYDPHFEGEMADVRLHTTARTPGQQESEQSPTPTETPTPSPTPRPTPSISQQDLKQSDYDEFTVGNTDYYVHQNIPNTNQAWAVTTPEFELVPPEETVDGLLTSVYSTAPASFPWRVREQEHRGQISKNDTIETLNRAADIGVNVLETYAFIKIGDGLGTLSAVTELVTDSINWVMDELNEPYKQAFTDMAATCSTANRVQQELEDVHSHHDLTPKWLEYIDLALDVAGTASGVRDYVNLYDSFIQEVTARRPFTGKSSKAFGSGAKSFLISGTIDLVGSSLSGAFELRARIAGMLRACHAVSLELFSEIEYLYGHARGHRMDPVRGLRFERLLSTYHSILAVAEVAVGDLFDALSGQSMGAWDWVDDATEMSETFYKRGTRSHESAKLHALSIGGAYAEAEQMFTDSVNRREFGGVDLYD